MSRANAATGTPGWASWCGSCGSNLRRRNARRWRSEGKNCDGDGDGAVAGSRGAIHHAADGKDVRTSRWDRYRLEGSVSCGAFA